MERDREHIRDERVDPGLDERSAYLGGERQWGQARSRRARTRCQDALCRRRGGPTSRDTRSRMKPLTVVVRASVSPEWRSSPGRSSTSVQALGSSPYVRRQRWVGLAFMASPRRADRHHEPRAWWAAGEPPVDAPRVLPRVDGLKLPILAQHHLHRTPCAAPTMRLKQLQQCHMLSDISRTFECVSIVA